MKRFEFRLEPVLQVKRRREWLAELRQQQARHALDTVEAEVQELQHRLARVADALTARPGPQVGPVSWVTRHQQAALIGDQLRAAQLRAAQVRQAFEEAARQRTQAAIEVESLQTLRRRMWEDFRQETRQHQQEQADELGMRRWIAAREEAAAQTEDRTHPRA